jgi:hypothetical protein
MSKKKDKELDGLLPEPKRVSILNGRADALVFPLGVIHLRKFNERISKALLFISRNVKWREGASSDEIGQAILTEVAPLLMTDLLDLLVECVRFSPNTVKIDDLPHWDFPKIVEEWVMESFGTEEKRDPWRRAIESTVARFMGKPFSISEMLSKDSSPEDGPSASSSESDSPESPTED